MNNVESAYRIEVLNLPVPPHATGDGTLLESHR